MDLGIYKPTFLLNSLVKESLDSIFLIVPRCAFLYWIFTLCYIDCLKLSAELSLIIKLIYNLKKVTSSTILFIIVFRRSINIILLALSIVYAAYISSLLLIIRTILLILVVASLLV